MSLEENSCSENISISSEMGNIVRNKLQKRKKINILGWLPRIPDDRFGRWGIAVFIGVLSSIGVSGGHLNPAVTVALAITEREFDYILVPFYIISQYLGAFLGASIVWSVYYPAIKTFDPSLSMKSANIFFTSPNYAVIPKESAVVVGIIDQIVATAFLMLAVKAICDKNNSGIAVHNGAVAAAVGATVLSIGICFGLNCGYAINPARDFSPRIFAAAIGYNDVFVVDNYFWWVPIVGPHIGALIGSIVYKAMVEVHWPTTTSTE